MFGSDLLKYVKIDHPARDFKAEESKAGNVNSFKIDAEKIKKDCQLDSNLESQLIQIINTHEISAQGTSSGLTLSDS